jgi:hypothetical protein
MISGAASRMGRPVRIDPCGRISQEDHPKATNYGRRKKKMNELPFIGAAMNEDDLFNNYFPVN